MLRTAVLVLAVLGGMLALPAAAGAALGVTVDTAVDTSPTADDGDCTYREAVIALNTQSTIDECEPAAIGGDLDRIEFAIGASDSSHVITAESILSTLSNPTEIDGRNGGADSVNIAFDGSSVGFAGAGLTLNSGTAGSYIHHIAIYGWGGDGILANADDARFERVVVGTDVASSPGIGNGGDGIEVRSADITIERSLISGNALNGINANAFNDPAVGFTLTGSVIGMKGLGGAALPNGGDGIYIASVDSDDVTIGGTDPIDGVCDGDCNLIAGNDGDQIAVSAIGSAPDRLTGLVVQGNYIGTNRAGTASADPGVPGCISSVARGVGLVGAVEGATIHGNLISGIPGNGIGLITAPGAQGDTGPISTMITGNRIGSDSSGQFAVDNVCNGISLSATIKAASDGIFDPVSGTVIGGETDPTPGADCDGDCNLIGSTGGSGIVMLGRITGSEISGNHVGVDVQGDGALPNGIGIQFLFEHFDPGEDGGSIGLPGSPNVISASDTVGIRAVGIGETPVAIRSNLIGTGSDGATPLGNSSSGIQVVSYPPDEGDVSTSNVTIGGLGAGEGNVIAHNLQAGVELEGLEDSNAPVDDISVLGNSIFANTLLGIDLSGLVIPDGVTENGSCDPNAVANDCVPFPVIDAATGGSAAIGGTLAGAKPSTSYRVELFSNSTPDPSGNGEGEVFLGSTELTTDAGGAARWLFADPDGSLPDGSNVAATATELDGSGDPGPTSEFSDNLAAPACTIEGTSAGEPLDGTADPEIVCGFGGADTIDPGAGADVVYAGEGNDTINTLDGTDDPIVDCGPGIDTVEADPGDLLVGCEEVVVVEPDPPADTTPPSLTVDGDKKQKSKKKIVVEASCDEICDLDAEGTIKVKILDRKGKVKKKKTYDLKPASKSDVAAGKSQKLKLKFNGKTKKKVAKVIKKKKSKAKVFVTATDEAGNESRRTRFKVKVKK